MLTQYPAIQPYNHFTLKVDEPHELYVEECGNPNGLPVIFLHGGPGTGSQESDRCWFDPEIYHVVLFDQRGSGRSTPHACLEKNTTQDLIADIERIREKLDIDKWVVFGGSWGSTLSLAYAQAHPERVSGLVVRGIFLTTPREIDWIYGRNGAAQVYPDYYEKFAKLLNGEQEINDIVKRYYELLTSENELERMAAAKAWSTWEGETATLEVNQAKVDFFSSPHTAMSVARIECHYFINNAFFTDNQLLNNMDKIADIPGIIVQGRYDMICPATSAWQLHKAWPNSQLQLIRDAGHASSEMGIVDALIKATQAFARKLA
jgi:proline iminopeptidase